MQNAETQERANAETPERNNAQTTEKTIFAAGCFWGVESAFRRVEGVEDTRVGYTGGHTENPSYEEVCTGETGHAEAVEVTFNPKRVSYEDLLNVFWDEHDPTQKNRQGPDVGTQYRSAIFYKSDDQRETAEASKEAASGDHSRPIATEIEPADTFWKAEEYHQQYEEKNSGLAGCSIF
jgi:peptide-methionine (S)-S-oxide reductase